MGDFFPGPYHVISGFGGGITLNATALIMRVTLDTEPGLEGLHFRHRQAGGALIR